MPPMITTPARDLASSPVRVAVIASRYNAWITDRLLAGAERLFKSALADHPDARLTVVRAPGTYELPALAGAALDAGHDAAVCLGCVIKGETRHDEVIADAVAHALAMLGASSGLPVAMGVLTVETPEQAEARAGGVLGNKGEEAMQAALDTLSAVFALRAHAEADSI